VSTGTLKIRLVRSPIGYSRRQKDTVRSLGFTRLQQIRELPDNGAVRGMVNAVCHLIEVVENDGDKSS
jgi:large subunit ribosomal protein L30